MVNSRSRFARNFILAESSQSRSSPLLEAATRYASLTKLHVFEMSKKLSKILLFIMIVGVIYIFLQGYNDRQEIENHNGKTICKYTFCKKFQKSSEAFVKYVVDNKLYRTSAGGCPEKSDEKINKYFFLEYSTINPNKIQVDFSKEVKNKTEIEDLELKLKNWLELK